MYQKNTFVSELPDMTFGKQLTMACPVPCANQQMNALPSCLFQYVPINLETPQKMPPGCQFHLSQSQTESCSEMHAHIQDPVSSDQPYAVSTQVSEDATTKSHI